MELQKKQIVLICFIYISIQDGLAILDIAK